MAVNPARSLGLSIIDRSGEIGRFSIPLSTGADITTILADADYIAFIGSLDAVTDGQLVAVAHSEVQRLANVMNALDGNREDKWLVIYEDSVTFKLYSTELPCRKNTLLPVAGTDHVDLAVAPWAAFVTNFEALYVSPDENAVNIIEVRLVGRNV